MNKVVEFLNANPVQYLATVGRDGKAKCRPFMFAGELDGKLWFCTNNQKDVYKDMQENPEVEISVSSPDYAWIRLHGKAVFENNMAAKEMCMVKRQENMKIPTELLPVCPHCGKPLTMNLRSDDKFVEDGGWHRAAERYENFLRTRQGQKILFLELGVGFNTPVIIKYPFWQMTAKNPNATYACINQGQAMCPREIQRQAICINADIGSILQGLS